MCNEVIRGLDSAYNRLKLSIDDYYYYSEGGRLKRAKQKLLCAECKVKEKFSIRLTTQSHMELNAYCSNDGYYFEFRVGWLTKPFLSSVVNYSLNGRFNTYEDLILTLNEHRNVCSHSIIAKFGDLSVGTYTLGRNNYLTGLVDNKIVFMFKILVLDCSRISDIKLDGCNLAVEIERIGAKYKYLIDINDYKEVIKGE